MSFLGWAFCVGPRVCLLFFPSVFVCLGWENGGFGHAFWSGWRPDHFFYNLCRFFLLGLPLLTIGPSFLVGGWFLVHFCFWGGAPQPRLFPCCGRTGWIFGLTCCRVGVIPVWWFWAFPFMLLLASVVGCCWAVVSSLGAPARVWGCFGCLLQIPP